MPGPATKAAATATIKQPHSVSLAGRQWALGQKEANHRADTTCAVTQVYLTPCREQIHTKQRGKKFSRQSKHLLQLQKPKLNDSARDRQRQRQKDEERERESGKLTSLQNGIMRRKRSHWKGKCPWPERADGKAKLELKLKLKETACSSHDSYGSEMEAELKRDLETSKASDTVISRPTTPWNH